MPLMWPFLIIGFIALFALVIRFFIPEFIYVVRSAILRIRMAKFFFDLRAQRQIPDTLYSELYLADLRVEASLGDLDYALDRIKKIREFYLAFVNTRAKQPDLAQRWKPQICIVEAANLLSNIAARLESRPQDKTITVDSHQLLAFICGQSQPPDPQQPPTGPTQVFKAKEVEEWFSAHPMSIEQISELLFAAIFAVAYRYRAQQNQQSSR